MTDCIKPHRVKRPHYFSAQFIFDRVSEFKAGKSVAEIAKKNDLVPSTLYNWIRKYKDNTFQELSTLFIHEGSNHARGETEFEKEMGLRSEYHDIQIDELERKLDTVDKRLTCFQRTNWQETQEFFLNLKATSNKHSWFLRFIAGYLIFDIIRGFFR